MSIETKAVRYLINVVREGRPPVTYDQIGSFLGLYPHSPELASILGYVRDEVCIANGYPPLAALVINARDELPGNGFWDLWPSCKTPEQRLEKWGRIITEIYDTDWAGVYADEW